MEKINKILSNKIISFVLIPLVLISFWFVFSLLFNKQISFSVLQYGHRNAIVQKPEKKLFKNLKIKGEFKANKNYLGIVFLRFEKYVKPDYRGEDVISFRIKEKGAKEWYYFNNYRSGLVENQLLFPIGFPVIDQSKNKLYQFEITSLFGNETNSLELSEDEPVLISAYQLPKQEILGSKLRIINYVIEKTINSFTNFDFILNSIIFILPLLVYIFWMFSLKRLKAQKQLLLFLTLLAVFLEIYIIKETYLGVWVGLIILWIFSIKINKLKSSVTFSIFLIIVIIWAIQTFFKVSDFSDKLNIWAYFFLLSGVLQTLYEEKKQSKKLQ